MSTRGLVQLEDLRRDAVERASRELLVARRAHELAAEAQQACARAVEDCARALTAARASYAAARTVSALRAAEVVLGVESGQLAHARQRSARAEARARDAASALASREQRLRADEVSRRSVSRTLEQRAADVSLRKERRQEDEADDAFRAQFRVQERALAVRDEELP